ncbi:MAG TPA: hypothetical protein VFC51_08970 [Chloroflexota bacterium]|nr:hypothetical protein [Chloroflexota bacterium]
MAAPQCLFVVSKCIDGDPSAAHLLKVALWAHRRGGSASVFLIDGAVETGQRATPIILRQLASLGVPIMATARVAHRLRRLWPSVAAFTASEDDLARLILDHDVRTVWY